MRKFLFFMVAALFLTAALVGCQSSDHQLKNRQPSTTEFIPNGSVPTTADPAQTQMTDPSVQLALPDVMQIWVKEDINLLCNYYVDHSACYCDAVDSICDCAEKVFLVVEVKNAGAAFLYTGALQGLFGQAQLVLDGQQDFKIPSAQCSVTDDTSEHEFAHLEMAQYVYAFSVPQDAPEGSYILELSFAEVLVRFDSAAAKVEKYVPCVADLPMDIQKLIGGERFGTDHHEQKARYAPVYGEFDGVYVVFYHFSGAEMETWEVVNGLRFRYATTNQIQVFTPQGEYSLTDAFEKGLLTAQQLQQVYDNYQLVGDSLSPYK